MKKLLLISLIFFNLLFNAFADDHGGNYNDLSEELQPEYLDEMTTGGESIDSNDPNKAQYKKEEYKKGQYKKGQYNKQKKHKSKYGKSSKYSNRPYKNRGYDSGSYTRNKFKYREGK